MNKDVVYIEPEDDITDIIARIKAAKLKLVALVPPKKIGVLRSAVNTKLVAKAAREADKVVVIVTTDSSLIKLAAAAQIPVAKNLQSRPKLPSEIIEAEKELGEQVIDESDFDDEEADEAAAAATVAKNTRPAAKKPASQEISSDDIEKSEKKGKNGKNSDKKGVIPTLEKYRKWIIIGASAFVVLIIFLVWAFGFAPAAKISVAIRTTSNNFSENVSFVTKAGSEKPEEGVFLLEEKSVEKTSSVDFQATGKEDKGERAKGMLTLTAIIKSKDGMNVPAGSVFSHGDYRYTTDSAVQFSVEKSDGPDCLYNILDGKGCNMTAHVNVTASEAGEKYNIGAYNSGWNSPLPDVSAVNESAFSGGTTKEVTVVSQDDFNKAKEKLAEEGKEDGKEELVKKFGDDMLTIASSLEIETTDPKSSPAVGEEGDKAKIEATTTYKMYAVDKAKVEEFVKKKTEEKLASDQRIYAIDNPFFENFTKADNNYTAKLKASTKSGPKVNEEDIMNKSRGKKVGEVQSILKSINGVSSVKVDTSFPWVSFVPDDPNKVTIDLKVEE